MPAYVTSVGLLIKPDPADTFMYPAHIDRGSLDALPAQPGVYRFEDEHARPLYIGKSVNIRARVLAHLRTSAEARLLRQTRAIRFHRTAGDIGAQLLEARLIVEIQPPYNKKLRHPRQMCSLQLGAAGPPRVVFAHTHDFSAQRNLYGLFGSRQAALDTLRAVVDDSQLCAVRCGLETAPRERGCFGLQIGRCRGACVGQEADEAHARRLQHALAELRLIPWPYAGAVGIIEECDGWRQTHVVDHWRYVGSVDDGVSWPATPEGWRRFDADTYRLLVRPLTQGSLRLFVSPVR